MKLFDIFKIESVPDLVAFGTKFERDIDEYFEPLYEVLDMQMVSFDFATLFEHMTFVNSYRRRLSNSYSMAMALRGHAKGGQFLLAKNKIERTEFDRESYQRGLVAPFEALEIRLEQHIRSLDSRVNECKKLMGIEGDGQNYGNSRAFDGKRKTA